MMGISKGWIGVDLDATLATYDGWRGADHIGEPVERMIRRVKDWIAQGYEVRIVTARVGRPDPTRVSNTQEKIEKMRTLIQDWCEVHIGSRLIVTNEKDYAMIELYDDRCVQVEANTGKLIGHSTKNSRDFNEGD